MKVENPRPPSLGFAVGKGENLVKRGGIQGEKQVSHKATTWEENKKQL